MKTTLFILVSVTAALCAWNPIVKRDERLDQSILQISSRYNVPVPTGFYVQPMHREPVANFLNYALDSLPLTDYEKSELQFLLKKYTGQKALLAKHSDNARINVNLDLDGNVDVGYQDSIAYGVKGVINPALTGHLSGFSFNSEFTVWTEMRNDTIWPASWYEPYTGNPYNLFGRADSSNIRSSDLFRGGVSWKLGASEWDFGVDHLKVGPSVRNPLLMNFDSSPVAFVRMNLGFPWMTYTHSAMKLQTLRDYNRYMMFHRFEFPLAKKRLTAGINEVVVYGSTPDSLTESALHSDPLGHDYYDSERSFEPVYLIPFLPFAFMEHFSGDRENKQISLDFALSLPDDFRWYLEFYLDDMSSPATLFSDDWGNKWAFTVGGQWFGEIGRKNLTISTEYSRIEPWVYTHFRGSSHRYDHFGSAIGSDMGPNSDLFWLKSELPLNQKHRLALSFENQRWNHEQRGGSINDVFIVEKTANSVVDTLDSSTKSTPKYVADSLTKSFLSGNVQTDQIVSLEWKFQPIHWYEMNSAVHWSSRHGVGVGLNGSFRF